MPEPHGRIHGGLGGSLLLERIGRAAGGLALRAVAEVGTRASGWKPSGREPPIDESKGAWEAAAGHADKAPHGTCEERPVSREGPAAHGPPDLPLPLGQSTRLLGARDRHSGQQARRLGPGAAWNAPTGPTVQDLCGALRCPQGKVVQPSLMGLGPSSSSGARLRACQRHRCPGCRPGRRARACLPPLGPTTRTPPAPACPARGRSRGVGPSPRATAGSPRLEASRQVAPRCAGR